MYNINVRLLKISVVLIMMLLPVSMMAQITVAVDNTSTFVPTQIVNGDFSTRPFMPFKYNGTWYNTWDAAASSSTPTNEYWTEVNPNGIGEGWNTTETQLYDHGLFEWTSGMGGYNSTLNGNGNNNGHGSFLEMNVCNSAVLYQDLRTNGNDVIRWSLDHAVRTNCGANIQSVRVEVGAPEYSGASIVAASGVNDNINSHIQPSSRVIYRASGITNPSNATYGFNGSNLEKLSLSQTASSDNANWHTVTGVYVIPSGQAVTRFGFIAEVESSAGCGNLLDNLTFSTLIGNLSAHLVEGDAVELKGYWGESDADKKMKVDIGSTTHTVDMSSVRGHSFTITIPAATIGSETSVTVYHEDYYSARLTIYIAPTYSVELASGTVNASDWSFSPTSAKSGLTVAINNSGTRTVEKVTVSRNITSTIEFNNSNASTAINNFNNTPRSKLLFTGDYTHDLTITRAEGEIDLNGHTSTMAFFTQNNQYGYSLTIKNGTLKGVDGAVGWSDWYCGTLIFDNVTMSESLWTDGHDVIIKSGTYNYVQNYKKGDTPGTVTIYGGKIGAFNTDPTGASNAGASNGTYTLYGGKYAFDPRGITAYTVIIPTGYAVQANTDSDSGTYPWKVVNTNPSYVVEFENFHLTEVTHDHQWTFTMPPYDVMVAVTYTDFQGHGTETEPYLIPSTEVWDQLATNVNSGTNYAGKFFRQTEDISVTSMVGYRIDNDHFKTFNGIYDGDKHKLNVTINGSETFVAPFHCIANATIKNLVVTGSVTVSGTNDIADRRHPSGLVGVMDGTCVLENCLVSTNVSGTDFMGGLIGHSREASFTITGCVYNGTLTVSSGGYTGGFTGWGGSGSNYATISNCLFAGTYSGNDKFHPIGCYDGPSRTISNMYYTKALAGDMTNDDNMSIVRGLSYKGEFAYSVTEGEGVTVAAAGTPTATYDVSKLDFYGTNGFAFNGMLYGGQGDAVSLNLSGAEHYAATTGTLSGSANPYTLTMAAANSEIVLPVASVTTASSVTSYYATLASAISAWEANSILTLLADVTTSSTILVSSTSTLDLNGHGIKMTGSGSVIRVASGKTLTLNDSDPTTTHKFSVNNSTLLATLNEASGTLTINGGYITGGYAQYGCAIDCSVNDDAHCVMNGGTLIGNTSLGINGDSQGVVCVSRDSQHYHNSFTMNGGAICYNYSRGLSILPEGYGVVNGGTIHHNKSVGIDMWEPYGLTLNNAVIMYNEDGGVGMDTYHTLLQIQGRTIITNNTKNGNPADICYNSGETRSQALAISGALDSETRIGIYYNTNNVTPGVFTSGLYGRGNASNFFSDLNGYDVKINGNGEALMAVLATITSAPTAETELVYNGSAQTLVNAGTAEGGTMKYSLDNSSWSTSIPTATNAGNYTVYYMVEGDATHADFTPSPNTVEVTIDYTISYDLNGGSVASANPSHYNITTATFTLNNPTKTDYTFTGWTGTDLDEPTMTVSIANGSTGNRTYTATFAINEYRLDSIPLSWQVKIGNASPIYPTAYGDEHPDSGYVTIPLGAEFFIIPSDEQKPLISKLELIDKNPPLTFEAKTAGAIVTFTKGANLTLNDIEYSVDNGTNWSTYTYGTGITLHSIGDKVSFRGDNATYTNPWGLGYSYFSCSADCYIYGNIMSLISKNEYPTATVLTEENALSYLFYGNTHIVNHPSKTLVLPATTLAQGCYLSMFSGCTSLTTAPELPATTLAQRCYQSMFYGCTGLTTAPELTATTLATSCYESMFQGCTNLTTAPELSATTLATSCYERMFKGCTNLTSAPALPATSLTTTCYSEMFYDCSNLNSLTCLATNMIAPGCTDDWLYGVAATGRFYKATSAIWTNGNRGVPNGWSVVHTNFNGFNSETTAHPILEITTDMNSDNDRHAITRNDGVVDLQGHTIFVLYCQNNTLGTTLTIQNGRLRGGIDGNGGWDDNYSGTVRLVDMTINDVYNDGHAFVIESGTYTTINNTAKNGTDYPGTYTIYGGYFNTFNTYAAGGHHLGTYTLYGGHYKFNPSDSPYNEIVTIASGYHVVYYSNDEYHWHVEQNP